MRFAIGIDYKWPVLVEISGPDHIIIHRAHRPRRLSMTPSETLILATYFFVLVILAVYGWHRYYLVYLYMRDKAKVPVPAGPMDTLPVVTVQLPIYNEMYVADRLIDAVCRLDYPRELLEIQVLDDSTDETRAVAEQAVRRNAAKGLDISLSAPHRSHGIQGWRPRSGHEGVQGRVHRYLRRDFIPEADFLQRTVPYFVDPKIAMVQTRWGHINATTRCSPRSSRSCSTPISCSSTVAATGRACSSTSTARPESGAAPAIMDAGGWQHDTLTETSTSATARSRGAGSSCSCRTMWRRRNCPSR
jgi:hypothetical protein